ncbi:hypothetical protein CNEO_250096 [Clostridium neonatale]|nr:hypothetical protein CNEO_250096 [Clostridium neonatale]CAI3546291.1 hypothetical protein CNEO3_290013 [Clostridium neonatale]
MLDLFLFKKESQFTKHKIWLKSNYYVIIWVLCHYYRNLIKI